jgi:hypothetical protein
LATFIHLCLFLMLSASAQDSELWGKNGEKWSPDGRLPDFSYAGYDRGNSPIPVIKTIAANIKDLGAKGDGKTDDTAAFKAALAKTEKGVIFLPAGKYVLNDMFVIRKPGIVLRGAGPDKTVLHFLRPLESIKSKRSQTTGGRPTSGYSWSGGLIAISGSDKGKVLTEVSEAVARGSRTIPVKDSAKVSVGQLVLIQQTGDAPQSLFKYLYANDTGNMTKLKWKAYTRTLAKVTAVDGNRITIDRPMPVKLDLKWKPVVRSFRPTTVGSGIEDLAFKFPVTPYKGHFTEVGWNAVAMGGVFNCWVRNVEIRNCDSGFFIGGYNNEISKVTWVSKRKGTREGYTGHHGFLFSGQDCMLRDFDFRTSFYHDIGVAACHAGNVAMDGKAVNLCLDHHKRAPWANLFTNIDAGSGKRLYKCGGGANLGKNTAAWMTLWKIDSKSPIPWPPGNFGPNLMNIVGVKAAGKAVTDPKGRWYEPIPPESLQPQNLYKAQLKLRKANGK